MLYTGWLPDPPRADDPSFVAPPMDRAAPRRVDLRPLMPPVWNQSPYNSCVAHAVGAAYAYSFSRAGSTAPIDPSRLFMYWNAREEGNLHTKDIGSHLRDCMKRLATQGVCDEKHWRYAVESVFAKPSGPAYEAARDHRSLRYLRIENREINVLRGALASGLPFTFGIQLFPNTLSNPADVHIPLPKPGDKPTGFAHAMLAVGYDDDTKRFIVRNSWGSGAGDKGYHTIDYEFLLNHENSNDFWVLNEAML